MRTFKTDWFAKAARKARIQDDDLADFRTLTKRYAALTEQQIARLLKDKDLLEICHADQNEVQERHL
jgi:hypothetical protein